VTCSLCRQPGAELDAGGDLGHVHQACFDQWDREAEAFELSAPAAPPYDQVVDPPAASELRAA
jgi:hypothetical protein